MQVRQVHSGYTEIHHHLCLTFLLFYFSKSVCMLVSTLLEKAIAHHSSTLDWKIQWTEEPGGLQSMGSLRVGQD